MFNNCMPLQTVCSLSATGRAYVISLVAEPLVQDSGPASNVLPRHKKCNKRTPCCTEHTYEHQQGLLAAHTVQPMMKCCKGMLQHSRKVYPAHKHIESIEHHRGKLPGMASHDTNCRECDTSLNTEGGICYPVSHTAPPVKHPQRKT